MTRQLHLNAFLMGTGHHEAAWRHPDSRPEDTLDARHYARLAQIAERGKLDSIFFADNLAVGSNVRYGTGNHLEPVTLLSAIAMLTDRIGLIATASTSYHEPFQLARKFASLDHISNGRAGWNIVTSALEAEARNFNLDKRPDHEQRYARATEFVEVVQRLWDSWADDARVLDKASGQFADPDLIRAIDHVGPHFQVQGPLNIARPVQGHPLLVQAGSSESGSEYAARYAEAVFTAQQTLADGQAFYADLKSRVAKYGRRPEQIVILPGICAVLGGTEAEAKAQGGRAERADLARVRRRAALAHGRARPVRLPAGRPVAGAAGRGRDRGHEEPLDAGHADRPPRQPDHPAADRAARRRPRPPRVRRHARAGRRPARPVVPLAARPTASTSCRPTCPAASRTSSSRSCPNCSAAGCSAPSTPGRRCASTTASSGRPTPSTRSSNPPDR